MFFVVVVLIELCRIEIFVGSNVVLRYYTVLIELCRIEIPVSPYVVGW